MSKDKKIVLTLDAGGTNFVFSAICDNEEIVEPVRLKAVTTDTEGCLATLVQGFTTVKIFRICSGLKRDSAQKYLDSLTKGEHPRLRRVKNGKSYLYFPIQEESPVEK